MGTVPIVIFRGLRQSRAQGHGELGPPHFPVSRSAWWNPKRKYVYSKTHFRTIEPENQVLRKSNTGIEMESIL